MRGRRRACSRALGLAWLASAETGSRPGAPGSGGWTPQPVPENEQLGRVHGRRAKGIADRAPSTKRPEAEKPEHQGTIDLQN